MSKILICFFIVAGMFAVCTAAEAGGQPKNNRRNYQPVYRTSAGKIISKKKVAAIKKKRAAIQRQKKVDALKEALLKKKRARFKKQFAKKLIVARYKQISKAKKQRQYQRQASYPQSSLGNAVSTIGKTFLSGVAFVAPKLLLAPLL